MSAAITPYQALLKFGHSPNKAAEIILDAKRGDTFSAKWVALVLAEVSQVQT